MWHKGISPKTLLEKNHKATKERFAERQDLGVDQKKLKENSLLNDGTHGEKNDPHESPYVSDRVQRGQNGIKAH
jgi:hypothetical protein